MGDLNYSKVDWVTYTSSANESHWSSKLIDCLQDNFLYQTVRCYTRYREGQQPSLLDLVIVNDDQMVDEVVDRGPLGKSDHVVLTFDLNCYKDFEDNQPARFIHTKGVDYNNFLRRPIHSSHQFFGEVTNQVTNFKSPSFLFQVTKNLLYNSVAIADLKCLLQLNYTAHFGDLKQKNWWFGWWLHQKIGD